MKTLELKLKKDVFIVDTNAPIEAIEIDDYEFLCKGSELTEEIASEFVEDYSDVSDLFISCLDDFKKRIERCGFYWLEKECDNQFCENGKVDLGYNTFLNCQVCEEAEEKTFLNPLIFVKNA